MTQKVRNAHLDKKQKDFHPQSYKMNIPAPAVYQANKVLTDVNFLFGYLSGNNDVFFQTDNFQRKYLHDLPKLLWNDEKIEDIGDFVLLFPNPAKVESEAIVLEKAMDDFDDLFETPYAFPAKKKFLAALRQAFEASFLDLDIVQDEEKEKKKKVSRFRKNEPEGADGKQD